MRGTDISGDLADLIRQYRIAAGLTQETLAERADVGLRSIQGIERGERQPHPATLRRLAGALGLSVEESRRLESLTRRRRMPRAVPAVRQHQKDGYLPEAGLAVPVDLPTPLTSFVGRLREVAEVKRLLTTFRLVTLSGPPGVGKTRLALEAAPQLVAEFPDGIFVVSLAAIRDPDLVLAALAHAVHIAGYEWQPLVERLTETLRDRRVLFILDNFEHVEAAAPLVARLLEGCPRLAVLATSRSRLRLRGEREFVVPSLALPLPATFSDPSADPTAVASQSEAVNLFVDRARHVSPTLALDRANVRAIAEICRHLDGLPLAIELAAARSKLLPPRALLARLADRFALLGAGPVDLPPRQQTLRAAIAWSYDLLGDDERALFRRLGVFVGGFSLGAVEAVCGGTLDELAALVDESLVQEDVSGPRGSGGPRFRMLETIREFAWEQLEASGEEDLLSAEHASYFRELAEPRSAGPGLLGIGNWDRLAPEHGNVRAALRYLIDHGEPEQSAHLALLLFRFWVLVSYDDEARKWLAEILEHLSSTAGTAIRARLLLVATRLAFKQSDNALARLRLEESLAIFRGLGDRLAVADGLALSGLIARWQGRYDEAIRLLEEGLAIYQELGDQPGVIASYDRLGLTTFWRGDRVRSRALLEQALAVSRRFGMATAEVYALHNLGIVVHGLEEYTFAHSCFEGSLAIARQLGWRMTIGEVLGSLGDLALDRGDLDGARTNLAESLLIHRDFGNRREMAHVLECFAGLAALRENPERVIRLWSAAAALREVIGEPIPPDQKSRLERRLEHLCKAVGEEASARVRAEGKAMPLPDAVAEALTPDPGTSPAP